MEELQTAIRVQEKLKTDHPIFSRVIRGILWDNDGLLVDSERIYFQANRHMLGRAGIRLTPAMFAEVSMRQGLSLMDLAAAKGWTRQRITDLRKQRDAHYLTLLRRGTPIFRDVKKTLQRFKTAGIRMGIVTSSQRIHFKAIHKTSNLLPFFDFVLTREDFVHGKPAPDGYRAGLKRLKLSANQCLAIEDSERGLLSAHAAGLECVVVPNRHSASGNFSKALAVLPCLLDLIPLVLGPSQKRT